MDLAADQVQGLPALLAAEAQQADAGGGDEADGREAGEVLPGLCQGDGPVKQQEAGHQEGDQQRPVVGVAQEPEHIEPELRPEQDELDDPVQEVGDVSLNAQIMAEKLAFSLERGWHFRRAGHATLRRVMDAGARGCYIILAGKLSGQRHRTEKFKEGSIKYCGDPKLQFVDHGFAVATLKMGVIGVTVEIMQSDAKLPAEIKIAGKEEAAQKLPDLFKVEASSQVKEE